MATRRVQVVPVRRSKSEPARRAPAVSAARTARELLRHACAVAAYRGAKAMRGAPEAFGDFKVGDRSRTPVQIVSHIADLYAWAVKLANGSKSWSEHAPGSWSAEVNRLHAELKRCDAYLASKRPLQTSAERLLAGPVADSLQHIGQLTMLRRLAGSPVRGENYARASITTGRVGKSQAKAAYEFD